MYEKEWDECRHYRNTCLLAFLAFLPVAGLIAYLGIKILHSYLPGVGGSGSYERPVRVGEEDTRAEV